MAGTMEPLGTEVDRPSVSRIPGLWLWHTTSTAGVDAVSRLAVEPSCACMTLRIAILVIDDWVYLVTCDPHTKQSWLVPTSMIELVLGLVIL